MMSEGNPIDVRIPVWAVLAVLDDLVERKLLRRQGRVDAVWNIANFVEGMGEDEFRLKQNLIPDKE